jgi:hypothetical protein
LPADSIRKLAIWTSLATIVTLNAVIGLGMIGSGAVASSGDTLLYARVLTVLHVVLPISSVLMFALLVRDRHWIGAAVFAAIIVGMIGVMTLRLTGTKLSLGVHLVTDLVALNIYLIVVPWYRSKLTRKGQR